MSAPGVGAITALSVASAFDDVERFKRSSSAGAYLGLTPRRYDSGEISWNGRISKHGNKLTRTHLYEAATTLLTRTVRFSRHEGGRSARPVIPIPRGSRPAMMACTTSGERKASERVIRIERSLQRSRTAI